VHGLLCLTDYTQHGDTTFWLSFGYVGGPVKVTELDDGRRIRHLVGGIDQQLLEVSDYRYDACRSAARGTMAIVPASQIRAITVQETKGKTTLMVQVSCSRGTLTAQWRKGCSTNESLPGEIQLDATPQTFELRYTFDGHKFALEKVSEGDKSQLERCAALPR
jgi:hypothetical protein